MTLNPRTGEIYVSLGDFEWDGPKLNGDCSIRVREGGIVTVITAYPDCGCVHVKALYEGRIISGIGSPSSWFRWLKKRSNNGDPDGS